ncbi:Oidioi.mRNA.OKI2018_I69.XSR.g14231.t1.cds [Oikopleura dioica]|uniref:Oidioi.mRNA.OKI2018_I69.XSR.g14231.t1.cds n=1 Tax=Oikopleura dioica TaxID=34765 RepID=A0ABN7S957_OIKDI|nr:Oidioi.mRNA.OKI2018_I69.XSR.g14231.t1.cds [Oikopleura dioica]
MPIEQIESNQYYIKLAENLFAKIERVQVRDFPAQIKVEDPRGRRQFFDETSFAQFMNDNMFSVKTKITKCQWDDLVAESKRVDEDNFQTVEIMETTDDHVVPARESNKYGRRIVKARRRRTPLNPFWTAEKELMRGL